MPSEYRRSPVLAPGTEPLTFVPALRTLALVMESSGHGSSQPLSIVMVSAGFWPPVGGAGWQALEQSAARAARGPRVTVLTRRLGGAPARETHRGVAIHRLPVLGSGALDAVSFLLGAFAWLLLRWTEWDAVHAHLAGS